MLDSSAERRASTGVCRRIVAVVACTAVAFATCTAVAAEAPADPALPPESAAELAATVDASTDPIGITGIEAVDALVATETLDAVAASAGLEPDELVDELIEDSSVFVSRSGHVGVVERARLAESSESDLEPASLVPDGIDVRALSSLPGADRVIYLDIDGHSTDDPDWTRYTGYSPIVSDPYSPSTGSTDSAIYQIWQMVSEDFVPFAVNVTTQDPGIEALRKTSPADTQYGQRMVISPTNWTGDVNTLGIAYLNVFDADYDHAAFVFTDELSSPKDVGEAVTHEAGHTFGLSHDGQGGQTYYTGHNGWAPLMGNPLGRSITQWSRGEYAGANNREDDIAIIRAKVGLRTDDHGNTSAGATALTVGAARVQGVIGVNDVDVFRVDVGNVVAAVEVKTREMWGNLHAGVTVRGPDGKVINSATPAPVDHAISTLQLPPVPGRYTIEVRSTGLGTVNTGFSAYGSLGAYEIGVVQTNAVPFAPIQPDRLLDTRKGLGGSYRLAAGQTIKLAARVARFGIAADATAVVLNVVAVNPSASGYVTAFPCYQERPTTSAVNYRAGNVVANTIIAPLAPSGEVCLYSMSATDLVVDVTGWFGESANLRFNTLGPDRVMDTRSGLGGHRRLPAGREVQIDFSQRLPGASAVALNIAVANASNPGYVSAYPCGGTRPLVSTVNFAASEVRPNNTIVALGGGKVCLYSHAAADLVVDLTGWFGDTGRRFVPTTPRRLLDTRITPGYVAAGKSISFEAAPTWASATAAAVSIAAVGHLSSGFVTSFDCVTRRVTATLNPIPGEVNANGAQAPLSGGRRSCLYTLAGGHLVVDLSGWWVP